MIFKLTYLLLLFNLSQCKLRVNPSSTWPNDQYHIDYAHSDCLFDSPVAKIQALKYSLINVNQPFESCVALGIPYSQLPRHRFEYTHAMKYQEFVNATQFGARCVPIKNNPQDSIYKNCLFLNVFIPHKTSFSMAKQNLPLLMMIHGGGFNDGSAENFNMKGILRHYVSQDIVVVTVNYRLGPFDFLVDDHHEVKNVGLYDVLQAYLFIVTIAKSLRGDPNKITMLGVDSGAVMAELSSLITFPGIVRPTGIIAIGGSISMPWAMSSNVPRVSDDLVRALSGISNKFIKKAHLMATVCASVDALINETDQITTTKREPNNFIPFAPVFDQVMFNASDLGTAMRNARPISHFYVGSQYDGLLQTMKWKNFTFDAFSNDATVNQANKSTFTCGQFHDHVDKWFQNDLLKHNVKKEYPCNGNFGYAAYEELTSDYFFMMPMIADALFFAKHNHIIYLSIVNPIHLMLAKTHGTIYVPISVLAETLFFTTESPYHAINMIDHFEYHYYVMHRSFMVNNIVGFTKYSKLEFESFPKGDDGNNTVIGSHFEKLLVFGDVTHKFAHFNFWQQMMGHYGYSMFSLNLKALDDDYVNLSSAVLLPKW